MSAWTHITGNISLDGGLPTKSTIVLKKLKKAVGKWETPCHRKSDSYKQSLEYNGKYGYRGSLPLPTGSEGPMMYVANAIGNKCDANNCMLTFWGNLRDFDHKDVKKTLIPWFKSLVERLNTEFFFIRVCSIRIKSGRHVWHIYDCDTNAPHKNFMRDELIIKKTRKPEEETK